MKNTFNQIYVEKLSFLFRLHLDNQSLRALRNFYLPHLVLLDDVHVGRYNVAS